MRKSFVYALTPLSMSATRTRYTLVGFTVVGNLVITVPFAWRCVASAATKELS